MLATPEIAPSMALHLFIRPLEGSRQRWVVGWAVKADASGVVALPCPSPSAAVLDVGERLFLELDRCFLPEDRVPKGGARTDAPRGAGVKGESPALIERLPSIEALRSSRFGRLAEGVAMPPSAWIVLEVAPARGFFDRFLGAHRFLVMGFDADVPVLGELAFPSRVGVPFSAPDVRPIPLRLYCQTPAGSAVALPGGPWPAREDFETGRRDRLSAARTGDIASDDLDIHRAQIPAGRANEVIRVRI